MIAAFDVLFRFVLFAGIHSLLASDRAKKWVLLFNWPALTRWYRLGYNILSILLVFWVLAGWPTSPVLYVIPGWWHLVFRAAQGIVLLIAVRCMQQTGMNEFLGFSSVPDAGQLVTSGCYGKVRHPLYTLGMIFLLLEPAPSGKWVIFTLLSLCYCLVAIRWEEQRLIERYGAAYRGYQATVPAFLPVSRKQPLMTD